MGIQTAVLLFAFKAKIRTRSPKRKNSEHEDETLPNIIHSTVYKPRVLVRVSTNARHCNAKGVVLFGKLFQLFHSTTGCLRRVIT